MKVILKAVLSVLLCLTFIGVCQSDVLAISNPSFEFTETDNFLTDWDYLGDVSVVTSSFGVTPTHGSRQALLTTLSSETDGAEITDGLTTVDNGLPYSGENAVSIGDIEDILEAAGLDPDDIVAQGDFIEPTEGSFIGQEFEANAGNRLLFDFNFLTNEEEEEEEEDIGELPSLTQADVVNDFALLFITNFSDTPIFEAIAEAAYSTLVASATDFLLETGYQTYEYIFPTTATYFLGLGVLDNDDEAVSSGLLVDNFRILSGETPIPEPASVILLGSGLLGLMGYRRKQ